MTVDLVRYAMDVKEEYGIQFYDALIVATAEKLGCTEIVSEDQVVFESCFGCFHYNEGTVKNGDAPNRMSGFRIIFPQHAVIMV